MGVVRGLIITLLLTAPVVADEPPVRMVRFLPQTGFAPLYTRFTFAIEPHKDNWGYCYQFWEEGLDEPTINHCEDLAGDKAKKFYEKEEKAVNEGDYMVVIVVGRKGSEPLRSVPTPVKVGGRFPN